MTFSHQDIKFLFNETNLQYVNRKDDNEMWDFVYSLLTYKPVSYLRSNIEYQSEYASLNYDEFQDLSCIIMVDSKPIAIWPLSIGFKGKDSFLSSQGASILPPIFIPSCPPKTYKKSLSATFNLLNNLCKKLEINTWTTSSIFKNNQSLENWHLLCMSEGAKTRLEFNLFIDLSLTLDEIKSNFRKSYRPLIGVGERLWNSQIHGQAIESVTWNAFKTLHCDVSGRLTRSERSWDIQFNNIKKGDAFFVSIKNDENIMVGGAYFTHSKDEGVYSVAAYDRSLFDKPLGHIAQYKAIEELKKRNVRWYKVGRRFYKSDCPEPSSKEISISYFKEGFVTLTIPEYIIENQI